MYKVIIMDDVVSYENLLFFEFNELSDALKFSQEIIEISNYAAKLYKEEQ